MTKRVIDDSTLAAIAESIRVYGNASGKITPLEMPRCIGNVAMYNHFTGKDEEKNEFWRAYYPSEDIYNAHFMFAGSHWNDETFSPTRTLRPTYANYMFDESGIEDLAGILKRNNVELDLSAAKNVSFMFYNAETKYIPVINMQKATNGRTSVFEGCDVETIEGLILPSTYDYRNGLDSPLKNAFKNCSALYDIKYIEGYFFHDISFKWSYLNKETITRVIGALSEQVSNQTITFNKHAINEAFGINVDDDTTWGEGTEFYELRHSKDNWTIAYA